MRLRPAIALITLTALVALTTGCSEQVTGSPTAGTPAAADPTDSDPSSTKPPATRSAQPPTGTPKPAGQDAKIGTKKNTAGLQTCGVLKAADVEAATGGKSATDGGCILAISTPSVIVTQMVTASDTEMEGEKKQLEIGGNTAWQASTSKSDCQITVMLTNEPTAVMKAFSVSVTGIEEIDACAVASKLATTAFERIPNA